MTLARVALIASLVLVVSPSLAAVEAPGLEAGIARATSRPIATTTPDENCYPERPTPTTLKVVAITIPEIICD